MNCTDLGGASSGDVGVIDVNAMTRTLLEESGATKENTKPLSSNANGEWKDKIHHLDVADHGKDTSSEWKDKIHHLDVEDHGQDESKLWKTNIHHLDVANHPVVSVADVTTTIAAADVNFNVNLNSKKSSVPASVEGEKTRAAGVDSNSSAAPVDDETIIGMTEVLVGADAGMSGVPTTMTPVLEKVIDPSALVRQQEMLDAEMSKSTASAEHSGSAASSSFATTASDAPSGIAATTWKDATPTKPLHDPPTSSKVDGAASTASTASFDSAVSASGGATTAAAAVAVGGGDGKDSGVGRDAGGVALTSAATTSQPGDSIAAKTGSTVGTPSDAIEAAAASTTPVDDSPVAVVESKEVTESSKPDAEIAARVAAAEDEFDETLGGRVVIPTADEAAARSMANVARAEKSAKKTRRRSSTASHRGILGGKKVRHPLRPSLEGE